MARKDLRRRGKVSGRPATQQRWTQPNETTDAEAIVRAVVVGLAALNPVLAAVTVLLVAGGRAMPSRARFCVAGVGTAATLVAFPIGLARMYARPYQDLVHAAVGHADWNHRLAVEFHERWSAWLWLQLPLSLLLGASIGGWWLVRRRAYEAEWRKGERTVSERRVTRALEQVSRGVERAPAESVDELLVPLGADDITGEVVEIPGPAARMHGFIAGKTGSGKTTTIEQLLRGTVVSPHACSLKIAWLFADLKADPQLVAAMHGAAHEAGRRFHLITLNQAGTTYNPIRRGTPEQIRSRIVECLDQVAGGGFSEPHHREAAEEFLLYVVRALDDLVEAQVIEDFPDGRRAWRRDLVDLARLMTIRALGEHRRHLSGPLGLELSDYLQYLEQEARDLKRSIPGLATRVRNLVSGQGRRILVDDPGGIDLYESIKAGDIVLFSMAAASDARASRQIGTLFLTDLGATADRLLQEGYGEAGGMFVAGVDEFSGLGGSTMSGLYQRIRGAGGSLWLATQDLSDLKVVSPEFEHSVLTNTNVMILHRQSTSAPDLAELLGTYQTYEETIQVQEDRSVLGSTTGASGMGSLRLVDKFKVHPNELKELGIGRAIVMVGFPVDRLYRARIARAARYPVPAAEIAPAEPEDATPASPPVPSTAPAAASRPPAVPMAKPSVRSPRPAPTKKTAARRPTAPRKAAPSAKGGADDAAIEEPLF